MKRIAFLGRGGHTLPSLRAVLNALSSHYEIVLYSEADVEPDWFRLDHRYTIRAVSWKRLPRRVRYVLFVFLLITDHIRKPFHLIHAHSTYPTGLAGIILKSIFKLPVVVALDGAEGSSIAGLAFGDLRFQRRIRINRWVIRNADIVTALTQFHRNEVVRNLKPDREIEVITRGVETRFYFKRDNALRPPVNVLAVGYLSAVKDPETLLRTFALLHSRVPSTLVVIGKDYLGGSTQRLAHNLGVGENVKFYDQVPYESIYEYYCSADILLHTSRYESQGVVISEALASGVLVFGTDVGLIHDLKGTCCVSVPPQNPELLAEKILSVIRNDDEVRKLRTSGYEWSMAHMLDDTVESISAVYEKCLQREA